MFRSERKAAQMKAPRGRPQRFRLPDFARRRRMLLAAATSSRRDAPTAASNAAARGDVAVCDGARRDASASCSASRAARSHESLAAAGRPTPNPAPATRPRSRTSSARRCVEARPRARRAPRRSPSAGCFRLRRGEPGSISWGMRSWVKRRGSGEDERRSDLGAESWHPPFSRGGTRRGVSPATRARATHLLPVRRAGTADATGAFSFAPRVRRSDTSSPGYLGLV